MKRFRVCVFFLLVLLQAPFVASAAEEQEFKRVFLEMDFDFTSGNYGSDVTTDAYIYTFIIGAYPSRRTDFHISIPYVFQNNSYATSSGNIHIGVQDATVSPMAGSGTGQDAAGSGSGTTTLASTASSDSQNGLGDITLSLGYILLFEGSYGPQVRAYLEGQVPTGDEEKGLGTGAYAVKGGLELFKGIGSFTFFGNGAYIYQEEDPVLALKNYWSYEGGVGYWLTDRLRPGMSIWGATEPADGTGSLLEGKITLDYRTTVDSSAGIYFLKGLATGSPDYGAGCFFFWNF